MKFSFLTYNKEQVAFTLGLIASDDFYLAEEFFTHF